MIVEEAVEEEVRAPRSGIVIEEVKPGCLK
jgi:hypothetical protein